MISGTMFQSGWLCLNIDSSLDNSFSLHLSNLRICYSKTAASVTHHGVELVERSNDVLDSLNGLALSLCKSLNVSFLSRNEFVKRRIEESDSNRVALECLVESLEIALLHRFES